MVNIALEQLPLSACTAGDANQNGAITVNEIIAGVTNALNGCLPAPTPTPTSFVCREDEIVGVVYAGAAGPGNELAGAMVGCAISGTAECGRSCVPSSLSTGTDGAFAFTVDHYFGEYVIVAHAPGYQSAECSVRCNYYAGCESCTIVLPPVSP